MDILGKRIRYLREKNNLSQKAFAEKIGITNAVLSRYELGERKPDPEMLKNIADCLDVSTDFLLGRTDKPTSETNEREFLEFLNDPNLGLWFKELKDSPEDQVDELRKIWEIIKSRETGRKPGDKQK
jgi:transcriptional regulator with XRE-family HTH domain